MTFERNWAGLFDPSTVAVVGASNYPGKWGFNMPLIMLGGGYRGRLLMVNPKERTVLGHPTFPSLRDIPEPVDLAVIAIPARAVLPVIDDAAAAGIRNAIIVTSDFSETGEQGARLERELTERAGAAGITIVGPNTMGVFSSSSRLCALGAPVFPRKGNISFISQSGNLGVQLLTTGRRQGLGFARFIGSGNAANTYISDYLEFLERDEFTQVILLYIEGLREGRRFLEVARRITPRKPIIALKAGKGALGSRAVRSHSGALAGDIELFEGLCRQAGVVEAETTGELMDLAAAFSSLPLPRGRRAAVMTLGGGWGVVAADACDREGLELSELPAAVVEELDAFLPRFWSRRNPVDIVGNVHRANHFKVIDALVGCEEVDMLITMGSMLGRDFFVENMLNTVVRPFLFMLRHDPFRLTSFWLSMVSGFLKSFRKKQGPGPSREGSGGLDFTETLIWTDSYIAKYLKRRMRETGKPIITVAVNEDERSSSTRLRRHGFFTAATPERAVCVAAKLASYGGSSSE